ncbi:hypothetical protein ACVBEG_27610 [Pseudomonas sp. GG8]
MLFLALGSKLVTRRLSRGLSAAAGEKFAGNHRHRHYHRSQALSLLQPRKYLASAARCSPVCARHFILVTAPGTEPPTGLSASNHRVGTVSTAVPWLAALLIAGLAQTRAP